MFKFIRNLIVFFFVGFCANLFALSIHGYSHFPDNSDKQFSNFIVGNINSNYYLSFSSKSDVELALTVEKGDSISELARFSVLSGTTLRFPKNGKYISLSEPGIYNFVASNNKEELGRISVLILEESQLIKNTLPVANKKNQKSKTKNYPLFASFIPKSSSTDQIRNFEPPKEIEAIPSLRSAGSEIYKKFSEAVVLIETEDGIGSGILLDEDLILTNKHVVGDTSVVRVAVKPKSFDKIASQRRLEGRVIKYDETKDLALVKLNWPIKAGSFLPLAKSKKLEVASTVHAIGHPRGEYWTYTKGYISQIRPQYQWSSDKKKYKADVIQTQTPINPGNSGGPLISENGELVGVNSFGMPDSPGLYYAVASTSIREFLNSKDMYVEAEKANVENELNCQPYEVIQGGEVRRCDRNSNGKVDMVFYDSRKNNGFFDVYYDDNENTIFEMMLRVVPLDDGSDFWAFFYDSNESGKWSQIGYDYDKNWKIDEWDRL